MTPRGKRLHEELLQQRRVQGLEGFQRRVANVVPTRRSFLIVCGGQETEPNYFLAFGLPSAKVIGRGDDPLKLVEVAIGLKDADPGRHEYWCVFDRDSFPPNRFNTAIETARANGFQVAYSNEAFELWYLLHYQYIDAGIARSLYGRKLEALLNHAYAKNSEAMYAELRDRQDTAIQNAERLLASYGASHNPESANPSTTVHFLVRALNAALSA